MIEGVAGLAVALLVAVGAAGQPDALEGWGWVVALAWTVAFALLDRRGLGRAIAHAEARRRGELVGAPVRLAPLAVLRVLTFVGVTALGWWEPWRAAWFGGASPYLGLPLAIVPFLAGWILSLPARRELAIARHGRPWPKGAFLRLHLRVLLVPAIMIGALLAAGEFASIDPVWADWFLLRPVAAFMVVALVLVPLTLAIVAPLALRFALPGHSLPPGALRTRFEEVARRESFRPLDIRVVDTSGHVINAAFVGILGRLRYVFIFDGLLERLDEDELVGVFAHEMGHSRRSHPLVYLALATAYSATVTVADMLLGDTGGVALDVLLPLVALVVFLRFVFSPVSRTFETEADVFAARALDGPGPIARALEALGDLHPSRRRQGGLLHPGIEDRVRFLRAWWDDPALREAFSGRILALRTVVFAYLALALIGLVALLPGEMGRASIVTAVRAASDADDEAAALTALDRLDAALRAGDIEDPGAHMRLRLLQVASTERQDRGDYAGAEELLSRMRAVREELDDASQIYSAAVILAQQAAATGDWWTFRRELAESRRSLADLETEYRAVSPDLPEDLLRERRDLVWMRRGLLVVEAVGALPLLTPRADPGALPDEPDYRAMGVLERAASDPGFALPEDFPGPEVEALRERWRADFLRRVADAIRGSRSR